MICPRLINLAVIKKIIRHIINDFVIFECTPYRIQIFKLSGLAIVMRINQSSYLPFLEEISRRFNKKIAGFSPELLNLFEDYNWPGNVRQLRSEVERLVALTPEGTEIGPEKCSRELLALAPVPGRKKETLSSLSIPEQVKSLEIKLIEKALEDSNGNRVKAAEALGITRQGLHKKMKRYQIDTNSL